MNLATLCRKASLVLLAALASLVFADVAAEVSAARFRSNGDYIQGWYWLRDPALSHYATWEFRNVNFNQRGVTLTFDALATDRMSGRARVSGQFLLRYGTSPAVLEGSGGRTMSVRLRNVSGLDDPVGYANQGSVKLPAAALGGPSERATLYFRVERQSPTAPHMAFRANSIRVQSEPVESLGGLGASAFHSNGDLIQTWYWLRDAALRHFATWTINGAAVTSRGVRLSITELATDRMNGGPGVDGEFVLRYGTDPAVKDGRGGRTLNVHTRNVSPPHDPVGYTNSAVVNLPASALGGAGRRVTLYLRVERASANGPHVAFRADSMKVLGPDSGDGTTEGENDTGSTTVILTIGESGRTMSSNVAFLTANCRKGGTDDADEDGVSQAFEDAALARLNPKIEVDEDENWLKHQDVDKVVNFGRVMAYPDCQHAEYIIVNYAVTWSRDYGRDTLPEAIPGADIYNREVAQKHNGDVERVMEAWKIIDDKNASLSFVYTSAHGSTTNHAGVWATQGTLCNKGLVMMGPDQYICGWVQFEDGRLKVQASEGKHAMYPTVQTCESVRLFTTRIGEDCGGGGTHLFPVINAGEPSLHLKDDINDIFPGEKIWSGDFCGSKQSSAYNSGLNCIGHPIGSSLSDPDGNFKAMLFSIDDNTARVYENIYFGGAWTRLNTTDSIPDLSHYVLGWNDKISSIKLGKGIKCTFYEHADYKGASLGPLFNGGTTVEGAVPDLVPKQWNDKISSVKCQPYTPTQSSGHSQHQSN